MHSMTQLEQQAISRAKLLGRIYYSADNASIRHFDQAIDQLTQAVLERSKEVKRDDGQRVIIALADLLTNLPIGKSSLEPTERMSFFVDLLFEKYNGEMLHRALTSHAASFNLEELIRNHLS